MIFYKHRYLLLFVFFVIPLLVFTCSSQDESENGSFPSGSDSLFSSPKTMGKVQNNEVDEASGIAASRINKNMLWTHNDSGDKARIFLMTDSGKHVGEFILDNIEANDMEDIAVGPGPEEGKSYIYLGDIGDNWGEEEVKQVYRFPEPDISGKTKPVKDSIRQFDVIHVRYPDMARDAETLMIDPASRDIYIVSKREVNVILYRAPFPQSPGDTVTMERVGEMPLTMIVGGDISPEGDEVLLKSYNEIYYWKLSGKETVRDILNKEPKLLPIAAEPQGEAIAWNPDASGYFTVSEEVFFIQAMVYYYARKD